MLEEIKARKSLPITIQAILLRADDRAFTLLVRFRLQEIADVLGLTLAPAAPPVIAQWMTLGARMRPCSAPRV